MTICVSFSKLAMRAGAEEALRGVQRVAAVAGEAEAADADAVGAASAVVEVGARRWSGVSALSRLRTGFGGRVSCSAKSVNALHVGLELRIAGSLVEADEPREGDDEVVEAQRLVAVRVRASRGRGSRPRGRRASAWRRCWRGRAASASSWGPSSGGTRCCRRRRSDRRPRPTRLIGIGFVVTTSSGLPRSQASWSRSPNTWQLEQDASPLRRGAHRVVEHEAAVDDASRLRVQRERLRGDLRPRRRVRSSTIAVVEARQHVEAVLGAVQHEARRAAAAHVDVAGARRDRVELGTSRPRACRSRGRRCRRRRSCSSRTPRRRAFAPFGEITISTGVARLASFTPAGAGRTE